VFDAYADIFDEVEKSGGGVDNWQVIERKIKVEHRETMLACFEVDANYADLSTAGRLLWGKYKTRQHIFYQNKEVKDAFEKDPDYKDYLMKLFDEKYRHRKTENKNAHLVLDLGLTAPRIFYQIKEGSVYFIYKYTRHDNDYERFLNSEPFPGLDKYGPFELQTIKI